MFASLEKRRSDVTIGFGTKYIRDRMFGKNGTIYGIQLVKVHGGDITFKYWTKNTVGFICTALMK